MLLVDPALPLAAWQQSWPIDLTFDVRELPASLLEAAVAAPIIVFCLDYWETRLLPRLQRRRILPYRSSDMQRIRRERLKSATPMTPLTASVTPTLDQVKSKPDRCHFIGTCDSVRHYVCVDCNDLDDLDDLECEVGEYLTYESLRTKSPPFSELFGERAWVEKRSYFDDELDDLFDAYY